MSMYTYKLKNKQYKINLSYTKSKVHVIQILKQAIKYNNLANQSITPLQFKVKKIKIKYFNSFEKTG